MDRSSARNWDHLENIGIRETCVVDGSVQDRAVSHEFVGMVVFAVQHQAFEALLEATNMLKRVRGLYGLKMSRPLAFQEFAPLGENFWGSKVVNPAPRCYCYLEMAIYLSRPGQNVSDMFA